MAKKSIWFLIFLLLSFLAVFTCENWKKGVSTEQKMQTTLVKKGTVTDTVAAYGTIQPKDYVDVGTQVSGILEILHVDTGDTVKKGDLLAEIDTTVFESKVNQGRAVIANLEAQLAAKRTQMVLADIQNKRTQELYKQNAVSEDLALVNKTNYEAAVANVDALKAQIDEAQATLKVDEANLSYTKIIAPMSGTIVTTTAKQGQTLNANQTAPIVLRLSDLDTMKVWAQVSEADVPKISLNIPAYFTTLGEPTKKIYGKVSNIYPTPEVVSGALFYSVVFEVPNVDHSLLPQMTAQVFFTLADEKDVLLVPLTALEPIADAPDKSIYYVKVLENGNIQKKQVKIGIKDRSSGQVLSGLTEGETVILNKRKATTATPSRPSTNAFTR